MGFFSRRERTLLLAAVLAVGSVCWLGCGGGDDDGGDGDGDGKGSVSVDGKLVCADGEAWVDCRTYTDDESGLTEVRCDRGIVFKKDGTAFEIKKWSPDEIWYKKTVVHYSTSGNKISIVEENNSQIPYSVSGNTLKLYDSEEKPPQEYTKMSDIHPIPYPDDPDNPPSNPGSGGGGGGGTGSLVCDDGEAWVDCRTYTDDESGLTVVRCDRGIVFTKNGTAFEIKKWSPDEIWYQKTVVHYSISGNKVSIVEGGKTSALTYSVSGNTLKLYDSEEKPPQEYTKMSGINPIPYPDDPEDPRDPPRDPR